MLCKEFLFVTSSASSFVSVWKAFEKKHAKALERVEIIMSQSHERISFVRCAMINRFWWRCSDVQNCRQLMKCLASEYKMIQISDFCAMLPNTLDCNKIEQLLFASQKFDIAFVSAYVLQFFIEQREKYLHRFIWSQCSLTIEPLGLIACAIADVKNSENRRRFKQIAFLRCR